jgi:hypothetical protein
MSRKRSFLVTASLAGGLCAALIATAAVSAPRLPARADAFQPPSAAELGLSAAHARQWDALRAESVALRRVGREDLIAGAGELRALLDQSNPDLRAFHVESQRKVDAHMAEMRDLRERQLALYESLSPQEQARVRAAMAQRLDRLSALRERLVAAFAARG